MTLPGGIGKWGPGVLGEEQYAQEQAMVRNSGWKYGSGVLDEPTNALATPEPEPAPVKRSHKKKVAE